MITVVIRDNGEESVVKMTYENVWKELKHIPDSEIMVASNWLDAVPQVDTKFVCFVEADCLVNSGYFDSMMGHVKKNPQLGKLGILSSSTAVSSWAVKFFGYHIGTNYSDGIIPNKEKKDTKLPFYTTQIAYIPGAVIRTSMLKKVLEEVNYKTSWDKDLVFMSTNLSFAFWRHKWMVYIAPNSTYVTTEDYVNDIGKFDIEPKELTSMFSREAI